MFVLCVCVCVLKSEWTEEVYVKRLSRHVV